MILLAIGDICGSPGLRIVSDKLPTLKKLYQVDVCIANGENADVLGIRPEQAYRISEAGADVITLGNHTWNRRQIIPELEAGKILIRPLNFSPDVPGMGFMRVPLRSGRLLTVVNLIGRLECDWNASSPFLAMDAFLEKHKTDFTVVDFHAEATSEKHAMAHYLDGRASAIFGTHTHVQTSDDRILPGGTGFITDLGMTGPWHSILGIKVEQSVRYFLGGLPQHFESPDLPARIEGCLFEIDEISGKCTRIERLRVEE